ncbi:MAG: hypothetical protein IT270_15435, partial [Saprospiraceae bacterium]|nr:hypothetical protein [Saprospiraceae bacterium]
MLNRLTIAPPHVGNPGRHFLPVFFLLTCFIVFNNLKAQDCAFFSGTADFSTTNENYYFLPFCDKITISTNVANYSDPEENLYADVYIQISFGANGLIDTQLDGITYTGSLQPVNVDYFVSGPALYRRFWFAASDLEPGDFVGQSNIFTFEVLPEDYFVATVMFPDVRFVHQDPSCGTNPLVIIDGTGDNPDEHIYFQLRETPITGSVNSLLGTRLNPLSFTNPYIEFKTIEGTLVVDADYKFNGGTGKTQLYLMPGAKILVEDGYKLHLQNVDIFTCDKLAAGIEVEGGALLNADNTAFNDCRFAIDAKPEAILELKNNSFTDNYIGLNLDMSQGSSGSRRVQFNTMEGNVFKSDLGLKTPYAGMPEAVEYRGYCGIRLSQYQDFNIGKNQTFLSLANG